jgi:hypothetical protein
MIVSEKKNGREKKRKTKKKTFNKYEDPTL